MSVSPRTDLAVESAAATIGHLPKGVRMHEEQLEGVRLTHVEITDEEGAQQLGRAPGHYITLELPSISGSIDPADNVTHALSKALAPLLPPDGCVLVVGLGNEQLTPDALGPRTARQILATRHLPQEFAEQVGLGELRPVAAVAPGVLGQTGIESSEVIRSLVRDLNVSAVIAVDALAARSLDRLGRTIQLADSGISPGAGVDNARKELSFQTLGVPVISMGIPTVVDGATLASELGDREPDEQTTRMVVTPREIDSLIERGAKYLSLAVNAALQPHLSLEDINYLVS